jgi:hypothetical protein
MGVLNANGDKIYKYMNFDQIERAHGACVELSEACEHGGMRNAEVLALARGFVDTVVDGAEQGGALDQLALHMQHRRCHAAQCRIARASTFELREQGAQAGFEQCGAAVDRFGMVGVDAEYAREAGIEVGTRDIALVRHALHAAQGLQQSGQRQRAFTQGSRAHAACLASRSSGASVASITAPPRHSSSR